MFRWFLWVKSGLADSSVLDIHNHWGLASHQKNTRAINALKSTIQRGQALLFEAYGTAHFNRCKKLSASARDIIKQSFRFRYSLKETKLARQKIPRFFFQIWFVAYGAEGEALRIPLLSPRPGVRCCLTGFAALHKTKTSSKRLDRRMVSLYRMFLWPKGF